MNKKNLPYPLQAILSGSLVWLLVFSLFTLLSVLPGFRDSLKTQGITVIIFLIPFSALGAYVFYRKQDTEKKGYLVGTIMALSALILDTLITVPFVVIPEGGSFKSFYADPLLWILILENGAVVTIFWLIKKKRIQENASDKSNSR